MRGFEEMRRVESLADQLPRHVGEGDDDGVDLARGRPRIRGRRAISIPGMGSSGESPGNEPRTHPWHFGATAGIRRAGRVFAALRIAQARAETAITAARETEDLRMALRLLIVEGNIREDREAYRASFGMTASESYAATLRNLPATRLAKSAFPPMPGPNLARLRKGSRPTTASR